MASDTETKIQMVKENIFNFLKWLKATASSARPEQKKTGAGGKEKRIKTVPATRQQNPEKRKNLPRFLGITCIEAIFQR
jgi:hypothetical protein